MMAAETQPTESQPEPPRFQFSLATLLFLCVVLASSLAVFGGWGIVVFAMVCGIALRLHYAEPWPSVIAILALIAFILMLIGLLLPAVQSVRGVSRRVWCSSRLQDTVAALQQYHQINGCFPPAYIADKNGKPVHSWRVLILPYLGRIDIYKAYDFTEPWDGPKNEKLLTIAPNLFTCPSDHSEAAPTQTSYVAVVGPNSAWAGKKPRKLGDFPRGGSDTIMLAEVADSGVNWMEPRDLLVEDLEKLDAKVTALTVSSHHCGHREEFFFTYDNRSGANVAMADGRVAYLSPGALSAKNLRKILQVGAYTEEEVSANEAMHTDWHWNWPNIAALAVWLLSVGILLTRAVRSRRPLSVP